MQNNPFWTKSSLPWFLILLLAGGSALFANILTGDTLSRVIAYINLGLIIFIWGTILTLIIVEIINAFLQKLYGCELIYINFFGTLFIKEHGKFKKRKPKTLEFVEFTFMVPSDKCPMKLAFCGQVYIDIVIAAVYLTLSVLFFRTYWLAGIFFIFFFRELINLLTLPAFPLNPFPVIKQTKGDKKAERAMRNTCKILGALFTGTNSPDMPDEWFELPTEEELAAKPLVYGDLVACNYSRLMDEGRFKEARQLAELVYKYRSTPETYADIKNPVLADYLFCVMMDDCDLDVIASVYSDELKKYLESKKGFLVHMRILYAYELSVNKNTAEAAEKFRELEKILESCPVKTVVSSERKIIEAIQAKFL
jgi:hypothetical protein